MGITPRTVYGLLVVEANDLYSNPFLDILDPLSGQIIMDKNGVSMSNLRGSIIELWDINSSEYPEIHLRFTFDSGPEQLATPVLYGTSAGTRIGTGFNQTFQMQDPPVNGVWTTQEGMRSRTVQLCWTNRSQQMFYVHISAIQSPR